jgi:hypothetical protein
MTHHLSTKTEKKITAIERRKAMLDALLKFCLQRQTLTEGSRLKSLNNAKTGLQFGEHALIVPNWKDDRVILTLFRSGEDWTNHKGKYKWMVAEDVSKMTSAQLERMLDKLFYEANPDEE